MVVLNVDEIGRVQEEGSKPLLVNRKMMMLKYVKNVVPNFGIGERHRKTRNNDMGCQGDPANME
jgi:hypothetical protein